MSELGRRHYRLLLEIDRSGTISAAASRLHITQSAASQQLREAERRLGFPLTRRHGRSIMLTAAAERLVDAAQVSEHVLSAAEADARWLATAAGPTCRVALGVYDDMAWIGEAQAYLATAPGTAPIELVRAGDIYGFDLLGDGAAHVVVAPVDRPATRGRSIALFTDELVGVTSLRHPLADREALTAEDFQGVGYVTFSTTPEEGFEYEGFLGPGRVVPREILRVGSVTAILNTVAATDRVTIVSRSVAAHHPGVHLVPLDPPPPPITWSMAVTRIALDPIVDRTIDHLAEYLSAAGAVQP